MDPLRIAILGAGLMGQAHLTVLARRTDARVCAVVDPAPAAAAVAQAAGVPLFQTLQALMAAQRPDGLIIATPNALHVEQTLEALAAGLPVLLEKPLATSVDEGQRLLKAVQASGARVLVGHHRAHSPIMARAGELVASGRIGRVVAVQGSAMFFKPDQYYIDGPWRAQVGAGPILINMIHEVHNLRMLCGEVTEVQALSSQAVRGFPVEDTVVINLRFQSGALGSFVLSDTAASARSWEQTSQENKAYASYADEDCYVIAGTMGSLSVPTLRLKTYPTAQDRSWMLPFEQSVLDVHREDPLVLQMTHFMDVIAGRAQPRVSVYDGLQNLRVSQAIAQAARSGGVVKLG
jgi:predicted dehydrogenase